MKLPRRFEELLCAEVSGIIFLGWFLHNVLTGHHITHVQPRNQPQCEDRCEEADGTQESTPSLACRLAREASMPHCRRAMTTEAGEDGLTS